MTELPVLDPVEQRVLGSLLEKQVTVPATYPLTANALRSACNQTSSREPVMDLDERTVETTARALRDRGLVRVVWADTGRRTLKYHQTLPEVLPLDDAERALVTVLLLRGAQSPGELRTRTERLHAFAEREDVEACLQRLAGRGIVQRLDRRPGQQDHRWVHLLGPVPEPAGGPGAPAAAPGAGPDAVDREVPLAEGADARDRRVRQAYDTIAAPYADAITPELDGLPFERWLLDRVVDEADLSGLPVVDAGCGPGHVTAHLAERLDPGGIPVLGIDLSAGMVEQAQARFPGVRYQVGDLRALMRPEAAPAWGAVLAWYSLIHLAGSELAPAVAALARPLAPGGVLLIGLHAGRHVRHQDEWFGEPTGLDFVEHDPEDVVAAVTAAGLTDVEWYRRGPLAARAEITERLYVWARRTES